MSIVNAVAERRVGTFQLTEAFVVHRPADAMLVLAGCLVIQCIQDPGKKLFFYTAFSGDFEPTQDGIPQYTALIAPDGDGDPPIRTWRRVSPPQS